MSVKEIASRAGVSQYTVYRVIKNDPVVSPATKDRVKSIMDQIGYNPKQKWISGGLRDMNFPHGYLSLIWYEHSETILHTPFVTKLMHGIEAEIRNNGLNMSYANIPRGDQLPPHIHQKKTDGIIMSGTDEMNTDPIDLALYNILRRLPVVWLLNNEIDMKVEFGDQININHRCIGRIAADYLLQKGCKNTAFLNPMPTKAAFKIRGESFRETILKGGGFIKVFDIGSEKPAMESLLDVEQYVSANVKKLLQCSPQPTGLFVPADDITARVYQKLLAQGIKPGKDITVISCNNDKVSLAGLSPMPVTIDVFPEHIGRRAVQMLIQRIRNPHAPFECLLIQPKLIEPTNNYL